MNMRRSMKTSGLLLVLAGAVFPVSAAEIAISHQGGGTIFDFGSVMSTAQPGEIAPAEVKYSVEVTNSDQKRVSYTIDFPSEVQLEGGYADDYATVAFNGPTGGETKPSGRDAFSLEGAVTRIPSIGGLYSGTVSVTVTLAFES